MHWREQRHRTSDRQPGAIWAPALTLVATILVTVCLGTMFVQQIADYEPPVGAIVVFKPGADSMDLWQIDVAKVDNDGVGRAGNAITRACILRPGSMAKGGGSLVVEARQVTGAPSYRVHWSGLRTSDGGDDCGKAADLILSRTDLQKLANSAGGFGVGPRMIGP
jgi:hypothetical protein